MMVAEGILTARGGLVSHAAVVARGWGTPAVVGAESVKISGKSFTSNGVTVNEGDFISLDGIVGRGRARRDGAGRWPSRRRSSTSSSAGPTRSAEGQALGVRANADTGEDATKARELGAEGIGLCRTEHMFLAPDRLPVVRRMILADTEDEEAAALEELRKVQQDDFTEILDAMDGLPVTVRLLDPPLHEFLPSVEELRIKQATTGLDAEEKALLGGRRELVRAQPDDRHPRRAPRRHQARPLRDAGAGAARRRRRPAQAGQEPDRRDHDPAHGDPRGAAPGPLAGSRTRSTRRPRACARGRRSRSAR